MVGGTAGVHMTYTREGRPTGEGYLEVAGEEDVENALKKHNEHLGPRYIEGIFRESRLFFCGTKVMSDSVSRLMNIMK